MEMELRSFPHADLTPFPLEEVPSLLEINSRLKALYRLGGLDPFDRHILQSLERCVNLTPTELGYLNQIELKYQQGQQSNPSVPDVTPLQEHSIPVSSHQECRIETFEFPLPPTLNEMIRTARGGWQASAKEKREWTELIASYCKSFLPFCLVTERVEVLPPYFCLLALAYRKAPYIPALQSTYSPDSA
jgi:hypothetical protein